MPESARRIASGRTWQALCVLLDHLKAERAIDPAELVELRKWTIPPGIPRRDEDRRLGERPRPPSGGGRAA